MRDRDVRLAIHERLVAEHADELDSTLFVDELGICGTARVDVAVVNASFSGFELKSASDSLRRLPSQVDMYSKVLDYSSLAVAVNHLDNALAMIPAWWGCFAVRWDGERAHIDELRPATFSPAIEAYAIAQLLWRDEALLALEKLDAARGLRSKPRPALWKRLTEAVDLNTLRELVRDSLKSRVGWRRETTSARFGQELAEHGAKSRF